MNSLQDYFEKLDIFSFEPNMLTFGDPAKPHTRKMWRTSCGGCCTMVLFIVMGCYIAITMKMILSTWNTIIDEIEMQFEPNSIGPQTFKDMKTMPAVVMVRERQDFYMNTSHPDFEKTVFVALRYAEKSEDGHMTVDFERFVHCTEMQDVDGYLPIDYTEMFANVYQKDGIPMTFSEEQAANDLAGGDATLVDVARTEIDHATVRERNILCP